LKIASGANVTTIFNPAPAKPFPDEVYSLCDYIAPNEVEAAAIVGFEIVNDEDARRAADILLSKGAKNVLMTLGARGVLFHSDSRSVRIPAKAYGKVIDTTGAGDAFLGGFASALSRGMDPLEAVKFGCVTAGIAVTRRGTAQAMPLKEEIESHL
jgi:ribokinase